MVDRIEVGEQSACFLVEVVPRGILLGSPNDRHLALVSGLNPLRYYGGQADSFVDFVDHKLLEVSFWDKVTSAWSTSELQLDVHRYFILQDWHDSRRRGDLEEGVLGVHGMLRVSGVSLAPVDGRQRGYNVPP